MPDRKREEKQEDETKAKKPENTYTNGFIYQWQDKKNKERWIKRQCKCGYEDKIYMDKHNDVGELQEKITRHLHCPECGEALLLVNNREVTRGKRKVQVFDNYEDTDIVCINITSPHYNHSAENVFLSGLYHNRISYNIESGHAYMLFYEDDDPYNNNLRYYSPYRTRHFVIKDDESIEYIKKLYEKVFNIYEQKYDIGLSKRHKKTLFEEDNYTQRKLFDVLFYLNRNQDNLSFLLDLMVNQRHVFDLLMERFLKRTRIRDMHSKEYNFNLSQNIHNTFSNYGLSYFEFDNIMDFIKNNVNVSRLYNNSYNHNEGAYTNLDSIFNKVYNLIGKDLGIKLIEGFSKSNITPGKFIDYINAVTNAVNLQKFKENDFDERYTIFSINRGVYDNSPIVKLLIRAYNYRKDGQKDRGNSIIYSLIEYLKKDKIYLLDDTPELSQDYFEHIKEDDDLPDELNLDPDDVEVYDCFDIIKMSIEDAEELHDILSRDLAMFKNKEDEEKYKNAYKKMNLGAHNFSNRNYKAYIPKFPYEYSIEGQVMNNCVASYYKKVMKGKCGIAFIRDIETDESIATLQYELDGSKVLQLRGKNNSVPSASVKSFANRFLKHVQKINEEQKEQKENDGNNNNNKENKDHEQQVEVVAA